MILLDIYMTNDMLLPDVPSGELELVGNHPILDYRTEWTFYGESGVYPQFARAEKPETYGTGIYYLERTDADAKWGVFFYENKTLIVSDEYHDLIGGSYTLASFYPEENGYVIS